MPKTIITKTRQKWLSQRDNPPMVQGKTLLYPDAVAAKFARRLDTIVEAMTRETEREVMKLFNSDVAEDGYLPTTDASITSQVRILLNRLRRKYTRIFTRDLGKLINQMLNNTDKASKSSTAQSLKELSGGLTIKTDFLKEEMKEQFQGLIQDNVSLFKTIPSTAFGKVESAVYDSIVSGQGIKDLKPFFEQFSNGTRNYAKLRAYDQTRRAFTTLNMARLEKNGIKKVQWIHSKGSNEPRKSHMEMDGKIFDIDKPPVVAVMNGVEVRGFGGVAINCFTGSTKVSLSNGCRNIWRYWYEGDIVNLVIGSEIIECTLNHPILTTRGWLSANEIEEGDYLISSQSDNISGVDIEINESITTFDDLFIASIATGRLTVSAGAEFNFHGDIPDNDVDSISFIDDYLPNWIKSINAEQIEKFLLSFTDSSGFNVIGGISTKVFNSCFSSFFSDISQFVTCEFRESDFIGLASVSASNPVFIKDSGNGCAPTSIFYGQREDACAINILTDNFSGLAFQSDSLNTSGMPVIKSFNQSCSDVSGTNFVQDTKILETNPIIKRFLRVDKKIISVFSGHVYTIESYNEWYSVTPAQIISKNCRCTVKPVFEFKE